VWVALVVFTSGIVDERLLLRAMASQYCQLAGVEPGVVVGGGWVGTLLGPERSGRVPVWEGVFSSGVGGLSSCCLLCSCRPLGVGGGVGGLGVCVLNSGREHLAADPGDWVCRICGEPALSLLFLGGVVFVS
jgi:hypothetical protein